MRFVELFAGIGGFRKGLEQASDKYVCVWANEWDKYAGQIYKKHFKEIDQRDITTVPTSEIPDHDLLVGGFPYQAFSIAGKRRGFDDTRGTLFFEIARILQDKQPKYFILENVKGLLSHNNGNTFRTIITTLTELGYDLQWQVVNSKNFGVPQNRERVFIVGHLRGQPRPKVFPITGKSYKTIRKKRNNMNIADFRYDEGLRIRKDFISPTLTASNSKNSLSQVNYLLDGFKIRKLSLVECERLQGFPDNWTEGVSDSQRYKCLGNAVTVNIIEYIGKKIYEQH